LVVFGDKMNHKKVDIDSSINGTLKHLVT